MTLGKGWIGYAEKALRIAKMLERRVWGHQLALRQVRVRVRGRGRVLTLTPNPNPNPNPNPRAPQG